MDKQRENLLRWFKGNESAVRFIEYLGEVSQTWDDLVDRDKEVPVEDINSAFLICLSHLPRNTFYAQHFQELQPLVEQSIHDWMTANVLEHGGREDRILAFVLRDNLAAVIIRCAWLIGGDAWATEVGPEIRRFVHDEPLGEYMKERAKP